MGRQKIDYVGKKFNRLTVLQDLPTRGSNRYVRCICDCGVVKDYQLTAIVHGQTMSCGCYGKEQTKKSNTKHGRSFSGTYYSWKSARGRCLNPNNPVYHNYGGRGIKFCDRWSNFRNFLEDMGERPSKEHTLDRINTNGDYEPGNCKWSLPIEQANNKRSSRFETVGCVTLTVAQWARESGLPQGALTQRLAKGMTMAEAISKPLRKTKRTPKKDLCA